MSGDGLSRPTDQDPIHGTLPARRQRHPQAVADGEGLVGYVLGTNPLAREYWTLSAWTDGSALRAFMRTARHVRLMSSLEPCVGPTKFVQWEFTASDRRPSWAETLDRFDCS